MDLPINVIGARRLNYLLRIEQYGMIGMMEGELIRFALIAPENLISRGAHKNVWVL